MDQQGNNWIFRNARLERTDSPVDLVVRDGRIAAIGPNLTAEGCQVLEVAGMLGSPLFIDPHHHLDCAFLIEPANQSGTLEEAIETNARIKSTRPEKDIYEKACNALQQALPNGTGWMRSHGDIDSVSGLKLLYPVLEAKEKFHGLVDVQIVAFPQLGLVADPGSYELMREAMRSGASIVGGMPHAEATLQDSVRHVELAFQIAEEFGADIDMHVDETDDPNSHTLELVAEATIRHGYQRRVTASHCCALAAYPDEYARSVIEKVAMAQMNVITNPLVNLYLQGRSDPQPVRRGITRVKELLQAGVNVTCGSDDIHNIFFPFGRMDMLEVAMVTSLAAHLTRPEEFQIAFDMPRQRAAQTLRLENYELKEGNPANIVFLAAEDALDALRKQPVERIVVRNGELVSRRWQELQGVMESTDRAD
jgi:cytosine/creatinine deaminase